MSGCPHEGWRWDPVKREWYLLDKATMEMLAAIETGRHARLETASSRRQHEQSLESPMGLLRRYVRENGQAKGPERFGLHRPIDLEPHDALWEFLTNPIWEEDGTKRETGTVLIFADPHGVKVMLNDKDGQRVAFSVVEVSTGLLAHVEAMLLSSTTDWRDTRKGGPRK